MSDPAFRLNEQSGLLAEEVVRAFDEVPRVSYFSATDGPNNASSVDSVAQGTLAINVSASARTTLWIAHRDGDSNFSEAVV